MKIIKKLQNEIQKAKNKLQKQLNKGIIYENFGAKEYKEINEKYGFYSNADYFSTDERNYALNLISNFENWCMNATPNY